MRPITQLTQQRFRTAIFVAAAIILMAAGALYTGESLYADSHLGETLPPHAPVESQAVPSTNVSPNEEITVTINVIPYTRDYSFTLGVTSTAPAPFIVKQDSLTATVQDSLSVTGGMINWSALFRPEAPLPGNIQITYKVQAPPCNAREAREKTYTVTTQLQELVNEVMTDTTTTISTTVALISLSPSNCGTFMPLMMVTTPEPTPTQAPTPVPFPQLVNGDLEKGPGNGWTEVPAPLIYAKGSLPSAVRAGVTGNYAAWLGGASNSTNTLSQVVTIPEIYKGKVKVQVRYYTASEEPFAGSDTARVLVVSGEGTKTVREYALSKPDATNAWVNDVFDLTAVSGPIELRFQSNLNGTRNSNWFINRIELCQIGSPGC